MDSSRSLESSFSTPPRLVDSAPSSDLVIVLIGVLDYSRIACCLLKRLISVFDV